MGSCVTCSWWKQVFTQTVDERTANCLSMSCDPRGWRNTILLLSVQTFVKKNQMASNRQQKKTAIFIPILSGHRSATPPKTPREDNLIRGILKNVIVVEETSHEVNFSHTLPDYEEKT